MKESTTPEDDPRIDSANLLMGCRKKNSAKRKDKDA